MQENLLEERYEERRDVVEKKITKKEIKDSEKNKNKEIKKESVDSIKSAEKEEIKAVEKKKIEEEQSLNLSEKKEINVKEEEKRVSVSVPLIELQSPFLEFRDLKLDYKIPRENIEKKIEQIKIPILKLNSPNFETRKLELEKKIVKVEKGTRQISLPIIKLKVPYFQLKEIKIDCDSKILEKIKVKEKTEVEEKTEAKEIKEKLEAGGSSSGNGKSLEEIPNPLELIFSSSGDIRSGEKSVILFLDNYGNSYIDLLEEICLRIYREKEGGEPKARRISRIDEFWKKEIEKWLDPSDKIITINLDCIDGKPWENVDENELRDRLSELYTGRIGFIIFRTDKEEIFTKYKEKLNKINESINFKLKIVEIRAKSINESFANVLWGNSLKEVPSGKFDAIFNKAKMAFFEKLRKIKDEEGGIFEIATKRSENESELHYLIKLFLVKLLTKELRKREKIETPDEIMKRIQVEENFDDLVPDIRVDSEVYEVETLFGEGENAEKKIDETIEKYSGKGIKKLNIVMDNFGSFIHLKDLLRRKRYIKKVEIEFYTLDLCNERLMPISEFSETSVKYK